MMLTTCQSRVTGDTDTSLLPVHVREPALQTATRRTEHLKNNTERQKNNPHQNPTNDQTSNIKIIIIIIF